MNLYLIKRTYCFQDKEKIRQKRIGFQFSEETKEKMRRAKLGRPAVWNKYPKSEDTKIKISKTKTNKVLSAFGEEKSVYEWSVDIRCVVSIDTLKHRVKVGWEPSAALTTQPTENKTGRKKSAQ